MTLSVIDLDMDIDIGINVSIDSHCLRRYRCIGCTNYIHLEFCLLCSPGQHELEHLGKLSVQQTQVKLT